MSDISMSNTYCRAVIKETGLHCNARIPVDQVYCVEHRDGPEQTLWCHTCNQDLGHKDALQFVYIHLAAGHKLELRDVVKRT